MNNFVFDEEKVIEFFQAPTTNRVSTGIKLKKPNLLKQFDMN